MFWNVVLFSPGTQFNQSIIFSAVIVTVLYTLMKKDCMLLFIFILVSEIKLKFGEISILAGDPARTLFMRAIISYMYITRWLIPYQLLVHELFDLRSSGEIFLGWNLIGLWYLVLAVFNKNKQNKPKLLVNSNNGWRWWDTALLWKKYTRLSSGGVNYIFN